MSKVCFYFQLHQPYRLKPYSIFDLKDEHEGYFDSEDQSSNKAIFEKVSSKSYLPMLSLLLHLAKTVPEFVFSLSCSGIFLEQAEHYKPEIIHLIQQLVETGKVELLSETYYHSLASLFSEAEFKKQVEQHAVLLDRLFSYTPTVFRNTELIFSNYIAWQVAQLGFTGILTEGVDRHLHGRSRSQIYRSHTDFPIPVLLKHAQLSDDIAFRFSNRDWHEYPLTADKYSYWLDTFLPGDLVNLFMDFETFGEHQWEATGIFNFFDHMVKQVAQHPKHNFVTPSQAIAELADEDGKIQLDTLPVYDVDEPISWADIDRDLTAWRGNPLQYDTLRLIYSLEDKVIATQNEALIDDWRKLQTSDHFYYMCVKWSADGDVHKYFSPYDSPFEAYNRYSTVVTDLQNRLMKMGRN
jgi:alpha-amylase